MPATTRSGSLPYRAPFCRPCDLTAFLPATFAGGTVAQAGVSDAAFKAVFDLAPEAIALARLGDGVILEVNAEWQALTGFSRAEVLDRTARD